VRSRLRLLSSYPNWVWRVELAVIRLSQLKYKDSSWLLSNFCLRPWLGGYTASRELCEVKHQVSDSQLNTFTTRNPSAIAPCPPPPPTLDPDGMETNQNLPADFYFEDDFPTKNLRNQYAWVWKWIWKHVFALHRFSNA